ncbi:helix-turn-helix domain-containing protein [Aquabacterium sp. A08]|uniref:helix-turn-helix domain-containing protein n=1 Tax=Aquabacterium sp. A08 TaxID=2718532 RepID=UPI001423AF52|nr:helix-turn-helix transcriptional regulator [Aquabacterium sp. A08]NIC43777.1 helix-turn-helix transcriptional regulator [Aquabacterium sp. A08]
MTTDTGALLVMNMGLTLRRQRDARRWSQERLAEAANLNRSYVGELERGEAIPSLLTLLKLARALGTTPSLLLQEAEAQERTQTARRLLLTSIAC